MTWGPGLRIDVTGRPAPQGSKRAVRRGVMVEQSRHVGPWRDAVAAAAALAARTQGWRRPAAHIPVKVIATVRVARPASHHRTGRYRDRLRDDAGLHPLGRGTGDVDKHARSLCDALGPRPVKGGGALPGVITDDAQVTSLTVDLTWAGPASPPGALIVVSAWMGPLTIAHDRSWLAGELVDWAAP